MDLAALYEGLLPGQHLHHLHSVAGCSAERWWVAFALLPEGWFMFDEAGVTTRVGSWADVQQKCASAGIQPTLLFF